jgi:hypothetical protein
MAAKTLFENMTAGLALQNVYIQLFYPGLRLEPGYGAFIGGFRLNVKLYFSGRISPPSVTFIYEAFFMMFFKKA